MTWINFQVFVPFVMFWRMIQRNLSLPGNINFQLDPVEPLLFFSLFYAYLRLNQRFIIEVDCSLFINITANWMAFKPFKWANFFSTFKFKWAKFRIFNSRRVAVDLSTSRFIYLYTYLWAKLLNNFWGVIWCLIVGFPDKLIFLWMIQTKMLTVIKHTSWRIGIR
jgi:hypothetical protein